MMISHNSHLVNLTPGNFICAKIILFWPSVICPPIDDACTCCNPTGVISGSSHDGWDLIMRQYMCLKNIAHVTCVSSLSWVIISEKTCLTRPWKTVKGQLLARIYVTELCTHKPRCNYVVIPCIHYIDFS